MLQSLSPQTGAAEALANRRRSSQFNAAARPSTDIVVDDKNFVAALVTEPPNASVHTFSGKLSLPPLPDGGACHDIPLGSENVLLRDAVLRNTQWAIGIACFTGNDTKLIQNSHKTPPNFSQLDRLMNKTVLAILFIMFLTISFLASKAVKSNREYFDTLFYAGFSDTDEKWPYLPNLPAPTDWEKKTYNWLQYFLLYITLCDAL